MKLDDKLIRRLLIRYCFTFILMNLTDASAMLVDELIVARYLGVEALVAVGLSAPTFAIFTLFISVFAVGTQSLCMSAIVLCNEEENTKIFNSSIMVSSFVICIVTLGCYAFVKFLCFLFGADPGNPVLFDMLEGYLKGNILGIPGYMGFTLLLPLVALNGNRKCVTIATLAQNVINVVGDYVAVVIFNAGINGVGIVTGISWNIAVFILLSDFFKPTSVFKFRLQKPDFKCIRDIIISGSARITRYISKILSKLITNRIILIFGGTIAMGAMSINYSLIGFLFAVGLGIGECVKITAQMLYSEKSEESLILLMKNAIFLALTVTVPLALVVTGFAGHIALFFVNKNDAVFPVTVTAIRCLGLSIPFNAVNCILIDYLQGIRNIKLTNLMAAIHRLVALAVLSLVLGAFLGQLGVFMAIPVSEIFVMVVYAVIALVKGRNIKSIKEKMLYITEDFSSNILWDYSISIRHIEDVVTLSRQIGEFLSKEGDFSARKQYIVSLCIEEMVGNVVEHGFILDNKPHNCDVVIIAEKDYGITIIIRDDCKLFDIKEHFEMAKKEDRFANIGIKLVYEMAKEVNYTSALNLNSLYIRI